jgi:hypothetical protein
MGQGEKAIRLTSVEAVCYRRCSAMTFGSAVPAFTPFTCQAAVRVPAWWWYWSTPEGAFALA